MRRMKDSGLHQFGMIPEHWEIRAVKSKYKLITGFTPDSKSEEYYDDENGYVWVNIADLSDSRFISDSKKKISEKGIKASKGAIIPKGSLLYSFKLSVGQVAFANLDLYTNEAIASFLVDPKVDLNFFYYMSSYAIVFNANENIYGAKLLNQQLINNAKILFPPLSEQSEIAAYLDQKVSLIDNIIEKTKQSIEEYKKLKQSIITEAVTKGLNPDVKKKDSGIEWIGMIPEHWEVKKISNLLSQQIEKNTTLDNYIGLENIESWSGRYLEKNEKTTDGGETLSYSSDCILFGKLRPYLAKVYLPSVNGCCSSEFSVLNVVEGYKKYLYYFLISVKFIDFVNSTTYGVKMPRANWLMISKTKIATPSFSEQVEIANILDVEIGRIDNVLNSKEVIISELESYKKSLIYEVVTGKKEIT